MLSFCKDCKNMLYLTISSDENIYYYCRSCGQNEEIKDIDDRVIVAFKKTFINKNDWRHSINPFTKFDPTLPRSNTIKCPNDKCTSEVNEIIKIRYDESGMKFAYLCVFCDASWITE